MRLLLAIRSATLRRLHCKHRVAVLRVARRILIRSADAVFVVVLVPFIPVVPVVPVNLVVVVHSLSVPRALWGCAPGVRASCVSTAAILG